MEPYLAKWYAVIRAREEEALALPVQDIRKQISQ